MIKSLNRSFKIPILDLVTSHYLTKKCIIWVPQKKHRTQFKIWPLKILLRSCGTHLLSFFTIPILLRCSDIVGILTVNAWNVFLTLWRRFCSKSLFNCQFADRTFSTLSIFKIFILNKETIVRLHKSRSFAPWYILAAVFEALWPSSNLGEKVNTFLFHIYPGYDIKLYLIMSL